MTTEKKAVDGPLIHKAMLAIMSEIGAIEKSREMKGSVSYKFRGIDQVYSAVHPLMIKHGVYMRAEVLDKTREERTTVKKDNYGERVNVTAFTSLRMRYHFVAADGSSVFSEAEGEGMDSGDKSSNKAMAVAHKYAILQAFCVPTEAMDDPDSEVHEVQPKSAHEPEKPPAPPPQPIATQLDVEVKTHTIDQAIDRTTSLAELAAMWDSNKEFISYLKANDKARFDLLTTKKNARKAHFDNNKKDS